MMNTNKLYKIIFKNPNTNKMISIEVKGQNKQNAEYNAREDLRGGTAAFMDDPIYKSYTEVVSIEVLKETEEPLTLENSRPCPRCNGTGFILKFQQWNGGICYTCNGYKRVRKLTMPVVKELN